MSGTWRFLVGWDVDEDPEDLFVAETYPTWEAARDALAARVRQLWLDAPDPCPECLPQAVQALRDLERSVAGEPFTGVIEGDEYALRPVDVVADLARVVRADAEDLAAQAGVPLHLLPVDGSTSAQAMAPRTPSTEAFLAHVDDVLEDWQGSDDAASWRADGSHEHEIAPYAWLRPEEPWMEPWIHHSAWAACVRRGPATSGAGRFVIVHEADESGRFAIVGLDPASADGAVLIHPPEPTLTPAQITAAIAEAFAEFGRAAIAAGQAMREALCVWVDETARWQRAVNERTLRPTVKQPRAVGGLVPPTDPRERALWLRQQRNTGPAPRRLDGRRGRP